VGPSCSESASNYLPWYASPTDSDGARTSDLSPVSGYFDWGHSSNNTSPFQNDRVFGPSNPGAAYHPSRITPTGNQSPFTMSYSNVRPPSCQNAPSTTTCQHRQSFIADYPAPKRIAVPTVQVASTVLTNPIAPSPKPDILSESNGREIAENEHSANSRSGKRWKAAHRAVERRYRSNLNLKIIKLGQCIPAIRSHVVGIDDLEDAEDCPSTPKAKLQKGHVLSKAVDYIQSLQQLVSELKADKRQLENRVESLHMLVEEDYQAPSEMTQCSHVREVPMRLAERQIPLGSRSIKGSSVALKKEVGTQIPSLEGQNSLSPTQNGFSFVSENPSLTSKRPRHAKGAVSRQPPG